MDVRQQRGRTPQRPASQPAAQAPQGGAQAQGLVGLSNIWKIVIGVVLLLGVFGYIAYSVFGVGSPIDRSKYQAVFLSNGQVYFGKLAGWNSSKPTMTDVYYFQASGETGVEQAADVSSTQTLVKLGEEIHKPTDKLIFNRDAILFVENIEDDGQVVEAIKKNQENE